MIHKLAWNDGRSGVGVVGLVVYDRLDVWKWYIHLSSFDDRVSGEGESESEAKSECLSALYQIYLDLDRVFGAQLPTKETVGTKE